MIDPYTAELWEPVCVDTFRLAVPGGWLYRCDVTLHWGTERGEEVPVSVSTAMCFVAGNSQLHVVNRARAAGDERAHE